MNLQTERTDQRFDPRCEKNKNRFDGHVNAIVECYGRVKADFWTVVFSHRSVVCGRQDHRWNRRSPHDDLYDVASA